MAHPVPPVPPLKISASNIVSLYVTSVLPVSETGTSN